MKTIDNLTLQPFKDIYDKFPDKPNVVEQTFFKSNNSEKIDYYVDFPNSRTLLDEKTDKAVNLTTSAYKRFENGKCFMLDEKLEPIEVSEQEMNEKGFWEKGLYDKFIYELFAKNQIVFRRLLFCDKTKLKAEELDDGE